MTHVRLVVRILALVGMIFWLGGFTFYSSVVIPILHEEMGGLDAGMVTGRVATSLNAFGVAAVVTWWVMVGCERFLGTRRARWSRLGLLGLTSAILLGLIALHPVLDARLDEGSMRRFYPLHQVYLIASTVQWVVNLALVAVSTWIWDDGKRPKTTSGG